MKITQPTQYVKLLETYRSQNDTVAQWLDSTTLHSKLSIDALSETDKAQLEKIAESKGFTLETFIADGIRVPIMYKELFGDYRKYCESEGITSALHTKKFYDSLRNKGYTDLRRITVGGVQERYFTGVIPFVGTGGLVETALVAAKDLPFAVNQAVQDTN